MSEVELGAILIEAEDMEYRARSIVEKMALVIQASSLIQYGNPVVAEAFCRSRLGNENRGWVYGTLPAGIDGGAIIERARPQKPSILRYCGSAPPIGPFAGGLSEHCVG